MRFLFYGFISTLFACTPRVHLRVLEPSEINVPQHVQQITYLDRSEAKNLGQGVLGVVEGLVSGEEFGQDKTGRDAAEASFRTVISESPRFELINPGPIEVESSLFDEHMSWDAARAVCQTAGCQGIVALESFDSDSHVNSRVEQYTESEDGKEVKKKRWIAVRDTQVVTAWRLYDVENQRVVDQLRDHSNSHTWETKGATEDEAIQQLPIQSLTVRDMGAKAGDQYGRRIAPNYITVTRSVFVRGDDLLKAQKNRVKANEWKAAEKAWLQLWKSNADNKTKARAAYNIAISKEVDGDLDAAVSWARKAAVKWPKGRTATYLDTLEVRLAKATKLRKQMGQPEPVEPEAKPPPPASPPTEPPPPTSPPNEPPLPTEAPDSGGTPK